MTTISPIARIMEELAGRYAGSKIVFVYSRKGNSTGVDVFAELASDTLSGAQLKRDWRRSLEGAFNEDLPTVRKFVEEKKHSKG